MLNFEVSADGYTAKLTGDTELEGHYRSQFTNGLCAGCHFKHKNQSEICEQAKCMYHQNVFGKEIIWLYEKPLTESKESPKETLSKRHKHADLMIQYANDCTLPVWVKCAKDDRWIPSTMPNWYEDYEYAVGEKPKDAKLMKYPNGTVEFYAPESKEPEIDTVVYVVGLDGIFPESWGNTYEDKLTLAKGIIHLTREGAELHHKALVEWHTNVFKEMKEEQNVV